MKCKTNQLFRILLLCHFATWITKGASVSFDTTRWPCFKGMITKCALIYNNLLWCNGLTGCLLCITRGAPDSWSCVYDSRPVLRFPVMSLPSQVFWKYFFTFLDIPMTLPRFFATLSLKRSCGCTFKCQSSSEISTEFKWCKLNIITSEVQFSWCLRQIQNLQD